MNRERLLTLAKEVSPKYLVALYLTVLIALGIVVSSIVLYPQDVRLNRLKLQLQQEKQKVAVVENFILAHPNMDQHLADLQKTKERADKALPDKIEISAFLAQLENNAREAGVRLISVKPAAAANRSGYREMPVELALEGPFFATMSFLKKLEDGARFTLPTAFMIQQKQNLLATKLNLQIFSYGVTLPPSAAPKPAAGPAPARSVPAAR